MSCTDLATFSGSWPSSQPRGLPVSTAQKRHARVHTEPINIMVAVPAFQHSPMFGHFASSHTVLRRCSRTMLLTAVNSLPAASGARSHGGLRSAGAAPEDALIPSLMAVKPCWVVYFSPLFAGRASSEIGMPLNSDMRELYSCPAAAGFGRPKCDPLLDPSGVQGAQALLGAHVV